jgi:hypothetical protein
MASAFMSRSSSLQAGGISILTPVLVTSSSAPCAASSGSPPGPRTLLPPAPGSTGRRPAPARGTRSNAAEMFIHVHGGSASPGGATLTCTGGRLRRSVSCSARRESTVPPWHDWSWEGLPMREAVICEPLRTPVGRYGGALKDLRAHKLGALVVSALLERTGLAPGDVDDVLFAQCYPSMDAAALGRVVALDAGLPDSVGGLQLDRGGGCSRSAIGALTPTPRCAPVASPERPLPARGTLAGTASSLAVASRLSGRLHACAGGASGLMTTRYG